MLNNEDLILLYGRSCAPERTFTEMYDEDEDKAAIKNCDASIPGYTVVRPDEIEYMLGGKEKMAVNQGGLGMTAKLLPGLYPLVDPETLMDTSQLMSDYADDPRLFNKIEQQDAKEARMDMLKFAKMARLLGTISLNGRNAFVLIADNVGVTGNTNEEQRDLNQLLTTEEIVDGYRNAVDYKINTVMLAVDADRLVPLAMGVWGTTKEKKGKEQAFQVFREDRDYFKVTGTPLYIPKTTTMAMRMKLTGVDKKQQKELEKALKDYEKAKAELDAMKQAQAAAGGVLGGFMDDQLARMEEMIRMMEVAEADDAVEDAEINLKTIQDIFDGGLVGNVRTTHAATGGTTRELAELAIMPFIANE